MFGVRARDAQPITHEVLRWLSGEDVELTPAQMLELRAEFTAMERYRSKLLEGLMRVSRTIADGGAESTALIESPASPGHEAYWNGYHVGRAAACGEAASALSELHVMAAIGAANG